MCGDWLRPSVWAGFFSSWKVLCVCNCLEMGTLEMEPTWHRTCGDMAWGAHKHHLLSSFWLCPYWVFFLFSSSPFSVEINRGFHPRWSSSQLERKTTGNRLEAQVIPKIIGLIFICGGCIHAVLRKCKGSQQIYIIAVYFIVLALQLSKAALF